MSSIFANQLSHRVLPAFSLALLLVISSSTLAADLWPSTPADSSATARIKAALEEETAMDFIDTPLDQVVQFLQDQSNIPIQLDTLAMDDFGIGTDVPVTRSFKGISLQSALKLILAELEMTYIIENEVLMLTTTEAAAKRPEVRVYNVSKLLGDDATAVELAATISQTLYAGAGFGVGGGGMGGGASGFFSVQDEHGGGYGGGMGGMTAPQPTHSRVIPFKQLLIVRHTTTGQDDVARLLAAIAAALDNGQ